MAELEKLSIAIEVIDSFSEELNHLLFKLGQVETAVEAVDNITIDVEVDGHDQIAALNAELAALSAFDAMNAGDVSVGATSRGGGGGGGGGGVSSTDIGRLGNRIERTIAGLDYRLSKTLPDAIDGASDSAHEAAENMFDAAEETGSFADSLVEGDIRMTDLHNAMARVVPILLVFVGAIPAIVGALVSLAAAAVAAGAALAALTGFAAIGLAAQMGDGDIGEGLTEMWSQISEDFLDAFMPLFQRLAPLFRDALGGLNRFFEAVASEGDALVDLSDTARDVGQWLIDTVPTFLRDMARFADAASGALGAVVGWLGQVDWFETFASVLAQTMPLLMGFAQQVSQLIPHLIQFSIGFLRVTDALLFLLNILLDFITLGGLLGKELGTLIATGLALVGVFLLLSSAIWSTAAQAIGALIAGATKAVGALTSMGVSANYSSMAMYSLALATRAFAAALALTAIGAIAVVLGAIAGKAASASTNIDDATKSLEAFQSQAESMDGDMNPYGAPDVGRTGGTGQSRFAGSSMEVNIESGADNENTRNQIHNGLYRMERPRRSN